MDYLSGGTLKQRLGKPIPAEAARLLIPLLKHSNTPTIMALSIGMSSLPYFC